MRVSAIVPSLNEERFLEGCLRSLLGQGSLVEVLVVDGGSTDATLARAAGPLAALEARGISARAIRSARGRAPQLNAGAAAATGDVLLFLHADTLLPAGSVASLASVIEGGCVGGAFRHRFLERDFRLWMVSTYVNLRSRWRRLFFGDQAIFVRRDLFERMGGFSHLPLMEDLDFSSRLRREGRTALLAARAGTSGRRFIRGGFWRTSARMVLLRTAYRLGTDPALLERHYEEIR